MSDTPERSRKDLLKAAGLAAGVLVGERLVGAAPASAADGQAITAGQTNTSSAQTVISQSGTTISNDGAFKVSAANADYGIYGAGTSYGVVGSGPGGVLGLGTVGGVFSGSVVAINLDPQSAAGAPTGQSYKGDLAVDSNGVLWLCVAASTQSAHGTWIEVSHGGVRPIAPQRAYDSRNGAGQFSSGETRNVTIAGAVSGVPSNAVGAVLNVTITNTHGGGFVTVYPAGQSRPSSSSINWWTDAITIANGATIGLGSGAISIYAECTVSPATDVIVDVTGYVL